MSTIAIILLNYNSTRLTKKCVHSLLSQKDKNDEYFITIVDNDSKNPPKKSDFPQAELVLSSKNLGFAQGNNFAVKHALLKSKDIEYLLLLNNDTRITKGMVRKLVERFDSDTDIGIVVPKILFERGAEYFSTEYTEHQKGKIIWYAGGGIDWQNLILTHKGIDEVDRGQFDEMRGEFETHGEDFATGCCMLTTPSIWKRLRGFDAKYFLYYEDADLSIRLVRNLHKKIVVESKAVLYHQNAGSTSGSGSQTHQYYQTRNRLRFGFQYASVRTKLALLREARQLFMSGNQAVKLGILHSLGGQWGNQTAKIPVEKR